MLSRGEAKRRGHVGLGGRRWFTGTALLLALLCGTVGAAEEAPEENIRILTTRFRSAEDVADAIWQVLPDLHQSVRPGPQNVLVAQGLTADLADVVDELLKRFDVPEETFQLRIRLIEAVRGEETVELPKELKDIAGLLGSVFRFTNYALLDDAVMVAQTGSRSSMGLAGGLGQVDFLAHYEPPPEGPTREGGSFAFDEFAVTTFRTEEREDGSKYEKPVPFLTTSFRVRTNGSLVVGGSTQGEQIASAIIVVLTVVTPADELAQPFLTLDLSTPEATVRSFTKAAATGNVGLAQACFLPGGVDYEDIREVLTADPSQVSKHGFRMAMRAIDPDGPITVISRKSTSEDEISITWRVTLKSAVSFTEGGKEVTFKPGDTFDFDASLKKVGDRWLIDNF